jgi:hypothetical protein
MARRLAVLVMAVFLTAGAACAVGAWLGGWWVPFLVGLGAGVLRRGAVAPAVAGAVGGWLLVLWALALDGQPAGATARAVAALAGLPPYALATVLVIALLAALQVLAGAWLGRAIIAKGQ